ncbi:MAG: hypothetical protein HC824_15075 [Synechococcales cyanobacterium RM1_1_8]|nr:hypothetical protein [Synechococcales cyanobacterium RM1_1_8]
MDQDADLIARALPNLDELVGIALFDLGFADNLLKLGIEEFPWPGPVDICMDIGKKKAMNSGNSNSKACFQGESKSFLGLASLAIAGT